MGRRTPQDQLALVLPPAPTQGSYACADELAELASEAIRSSGKSRERVAAELTDLTGTSITPHMLNAWTATSKEAHRFPAEFLGAFAYVTGSADMLELLAGQAGLHVISPREQARLEVLDLDEQIRELRRRKQVLKAMADGVGGQR